ncbi:MAG: hypothetical protein M1828_006355 [Chrysothrix sp. TS-e1954]|nr:MAG: hypothetical protein M1828_006355 [Chrysothrix sp. TS-e1954]
MAEVLRAPSLYNGETHHTPESLLRHSPPTNSPIYIGTPRSFSPQRSSSSSSADEASDHLGSQSSSSPPSPQIGPYLSRTSSYHSTPPSSISLNSKDDSEDVDCSWLPTYTNTISKKSAEPPPPRLRQADLPQSPAPTPDTVSTPTDDAETGSLLPLVADDSAVQDEPSRQVDYLSHDWREEDIWSSWKHIVSRRNQYGEISRLENASWRQWAKQKDSLGTVRPETLNWLKDCDVTWLYGPLKEAPVDRRASEPASQMSKTNSFLNKKPILKKRSASEVMLQKSRSSSSLLKEAAAEVQAQRSLLGRGRTVSRPVLRRSLSDFGAPSLPPLQTGVADQTNSFPSSSSSGIQSPDGAGRRHIRFDNKVEQCIAVDFKQGAEGKTASPSWTRGDSEDYDDDDDDDDDDEYMPTLKASTKKHWPTPSSSRNSFSQESKGIAMLPSTTLKFHHDELDCQGHPPSPYFSPSWKSAGTLSHSSSQETLKPSDPSSNFLIDDDEEADMAWEPSGAFGNLKRDSMAITRDDANDSDDNEQQKPGPGLRRTPSGMFMPYDDDEEGSFAHGGVLGRLVDTVNTARDIATVVWNVGWRK